jgi:subtilisin family serine protease
MKKILKSGKSGHEELESASQSVSVSSSAPIPPTPSATVSSLLTEKTAGAGGGAPLSSGGLAGSSGSSSPTSGPNASGSTASAPLVELGSTTFSFGGENFFARPAAYSSNAGAPGTQSLVAKPDFVPGELIIRFAPGDSLHGQAMGIQKALSAIGGNVLEWLESANNGDGSVAFRVSVDNAIGLEKAISILSNMPGVEAAEYNWIHTVQLVSNDPGYTNGSLWGAYGDGSPTKTNAYGSQAAELWDKGYTGSMSTVLGIIDEGVDFTHPDLYLNIWLNQGEIRELSFYDQLMALEKGLDNDGIITFRDLNAKTISGQWVFGSYVTDINRNGRIDADDLLRDSRWANGKDSGFDSNGYIDDLVGWDFVGNDNRPFDGSADDHGTLVAGTIGAIGGNSIGIAGVNWEIQMMALKFLGTNGGSIANAINAVNYYTNMALDAAKFGYNGNYIGTTNSWGGGGYSSTLLNAIISAARADLFFIAAAGNSSSNNDLTASYPSGYSTFSALGWEAVVAVASITNTGALSSFSSYGSTTVDLGAPGSSIYSTLPGNTYGTYSGTSMATPHVSGALALLASIYPTATAAQLLALLFAAVEYTPSLDGKTLYDGRLDLGDVALPLGVVTPPADTTPPTLTITMSDTALTVGETATVTFTFSEAIKDFISSDILFDAAAGSISGLTTADNITWTATYTPQSNVSDSENVISVGNGTYQDMAGNNGAGATSVNFTVNTVILGGTFYGTTGSDTVTGSIYADIISGIPSSGDTTYGRGTVDYLYGSGGNDRFVLGDSNAVYYDDGNARNAGKGDYAAIMDFNSGDVVQLKTGTYFFISGTFNGAGSTGIYLDTNGSKAYDTKDEFIGVIFGVAPNQLPAGSIVYA